MTSDRIRDIRREILSENWYRLYKYTYEFQKPDGKWETQAREVYDRGNGAAILLFNRERRSVILTRQFRMPTFVNGNESGMMTEVCAGLLEGDSPEDCIKKEVEEETGYRVDKVKKVFEAYMSPGSVTEVLHFFTGEYGERMRVGEGGGSDEETENIEVVEYAFTDAVQAMATGEIRDAKTIMLLQYASLHRLLDSE